MPEPLTVERFAQYERRAEERHHELIFAVADVVTRVNEHFDERLDRLERLQDLEQRLERFETETRTKFRKVGEHLAIPEVTVG